MKLALVALRSQGPPRLDYVGPRRASCLRRLQRRTLAAHVCLKRQGHQAVGPAAAAVRTDADRRQYACTAGPRQLCAV